MAIVTRLDITPAEFDRRQDRLRSRWAALIENLQAAEDGDTFSICLREEENTGTARKRARQSIYAIARHYGISIRICSTPLAILVMKMAAQTPSIPPPARPEPSGVQSSPS